MQSHAIIFSYKSDVEEIFNFLQANGCYGVSGCFTLLTGETGKVEVYFSQGLGQTPEFGTSGRIIGLQMKAVQPPRLSGNTLLCTLEIDAN